MTATQVADRELNRAIVAVMCDNPTGTRSRFWSMEYAYPGQPFLTGVTSVGRNEFKYSIYATTVMGLGSAASNNRVKMVEVYVSWWEGERQGYGELRIHSYRLFNEGDRP